MHSHRFVETAQDAELVQILDQSINGVLLLDFEGRTLYSSPSARRILGLALHEAAPEVPVDLAQGADRAALQALRQQALEHKGQAFTHRFRLPAADGMLRWVDGSIRWFSWRGRECFFGVLVDLATEERLTVELEEQRQRLAMIVESVSDLILELDVKGQVRFSTLAWKKIFGQQAAGPLSLLERLEDASRERLLKALLQPVGATAREEGLGDLRLGLGGDRALLVEAALHQVPRPEGGHRSFLIGRDVTAERTAERLMLDYERSAALGSLAASMAHEVRSPLGVIAANLELMEMAGPDGEGIQRHAERMRHAIARINGLLEDTLKFSRKPRGGDVAAMAPAVEQALRSARLQSAHDDDRTKVQLELEPELPAVRINPHRLEQVLHHLCLNAFQALDGRGQLWVRASRQGQGVRVQVDDDGPGIAAAAHEKVTQAFFTTKQHGTGLGLWVCHNLLGEVGSKLDLGQGPAGGACFSFKLSLAPESALFS